MEGLAEEIAGEACAERREQGRPRGDAHAPAEPVRTDPRRRTGHLPRLQPARLAVERAEIHRQYRALGQRLHAGIADHREARRLDVDLRPAPRVGRVIGQPEDAAPVRPLQGAGEEEPQGGRPK
ncbi:hypothetical protein [Methylobacterium gregans]|uniref:hypothetical protein n=1 Tax=Methylobacterium gregans TaxID=374424 RepID=UPI00361FB33A